jgi:cyclohexanone monooxygenase
MSEQQTDLDLVVIGAGFAGLAMLHRARESGLHTRVLEAGDGVGGTWFWNRYPGARTDSECYYYCLSFSPEVVAEWTWSERYPGQPEMLRYLNFVADKFDLKRDITFGTRVESAVFDEGSGTWEVTTDTGESVRSRFVVTGLGLLTEPHIPDFPGLDSFTGETYMTCRWPADGVDLSGKRVGIIGTGATGVQAIPLIAQEAAHLTVFQRTPNYVMPSRNHALSEFQRTALKRDYDTISKKTREHVFAFPMDAAGRLGSELSDEELEQVLERGWETGGFRYIFETVDDMLVDQRTNDAASEFVRRKIRAIVNDPETAELLCPTTHPIGGKRPPLGAFYYETFNRPNVSLVSVREDPIQEITATGLKTGTAEYEFDVIIYATGFDAITGPLTQMNVHGTADRSLGEEWTSGSTRMHLGLTAAGYPNLFAILGPQAPFASHPPVIEAQVELIGKLIKQTLDTGSERIEATEEATQGWSDMCDMILGATLIPQGVGDRPWFLGANVPGKTPSTLCYLGGMAGYGAEVAKEVESGFPGYQFS